MAQRFQVHPSPFSTTTHAVVDAAQTERDPRGKVVYRGHSYEDNQLMAQTLNRMDGDMLEDNRV